MTLCFINLLYILLYIDRFFYFFLQVQKRSLEMLASRTWWLKTATTEVAKHISVSSTACGPCGTVCWPPCLMSIPFCWPLGDYRVRLCTYIYFRSIPCSATWRQCPKFLAMSDCNGYLIGPMSVMPVDTAVFVGSTSAYISLINLLIDEFHQCHL